MSTNPILVYTDARKRFDAARNALLGAANNIQNVAVAMMHDWQKLRVAGVPLKGALMGSSAISFNRANWPTGDQIHAMILECHEAFNALENAYRGMSGPDQAALCPNGAPRP